MVDEKFIDGLISRWENLEPDCDEDDEDLLEEIEFDGSEDDAMTYDEEVSRYGCSIAERHYESRLNQMY